MTTETTDALLDLRNRMRRAKYPEGLNSYDDGYNHGLNLSIKMVDEALSTMVGSGT